MNVLPRYPSVVGEYCTVVALSFLWYIQCQKLIILLNINNYYCVVIDALF